MEWRRRVLRQKAGTHCPERRACYRRESVGQRSSLPVDVEHGSPERCGRKAGREALDQPGKHQPLDQSYCWNASSRPSCIGFCSLPRRPRPKKRTAFSTRS